MAKTALAVITQHHAPDVMKQRIKICDEEHRQQRRAASAGTQKPWEEVTTSVGCQRNAAAEITAFPTGIMSSGEMPTSEIFSL